MNDSNIHNEIILFLFLHSSVNGIWGEWASWGACSKTCRTGGTQTRQRTCNNPSPKYGGKHCDGESSGSKSCNEIPCPG